MSREVHVRFREGAGVRVPCATRFCITGASKELLEQEVKPLVAQCLQERGLTLSQAKTKIMHIDDAFDFLGQNLRKYRGKLLIKLSHKSVHAVLANVRRIIKEHKQLSAGKLIAKNLSQSNECIDRSPSSPRGGVP